MPVLQVLIDDIFSIAAVQLNLYNYNWKLWIQIRKEDSSEHKPEPQSPHSPQINTLLKYLLN